MGVHAVMITFCHIAQGNVFFISRVGSGQLLLSGCVPAKEGNGGGDDKKTESKISGIYSYSKQNRLCFKFGGREICAPRLFFL